MTAKRKYVAMDIEIAKVVPDGEADWKAYRPLGITCIALMASDWKGAEVYSKYTGEGPVPAMSQEDVAVVVRHLETLAGRGYTLLTHNGLGFDWDILAEESGLHDLCCRLAMGHVDTMFNVFALRGFPLGLDKIAKGIGLSGKTEGMNGALAPQMWADGECEKVLAYVAQDALTTLQVAERVERMGYLTWTSRSGRQQGLMLPYDGWMTVEEALRLPEPNNSWMSDPWPRSRFTGWMTQKATA